MRKIKKIIITMLIMTLICGCRAGVKNDVSTEETQNFAENPYLFQVKIDDYVYELPVWYDEFVEMGWVYEGNAETFIPAGEYCIDRVFEKDGIKISAQMANFSNSAKPLSECSITGIEFNYYYEGGNYADVYFAGGLKFNTMTAEELIETYGRPTSADKSYDYYTIKYELNENRGYEFYFEMEKEILMSAKIYNLIELDGTDHSIQAEPADSKVYEKKMPDYVKNLQMPEKMSDYLFDYNFELNGNVLSLPCPVEKILESGFVIEKDYENMVLSEGEFNTAVFVCNGREVVYCIENLSDEPMPIQNCIVSSMKISSYMTDEIQLTFPGGITTESTKADVEAFLCDYEYEMKESNDYYTYWVYPPDDKYGWTKYEFSVRKKDDTVLSFGGYVDSEKVMGGK